MYTSPNRGSPCGEEIPSHPRERHTEFSGRPSAGEGGPGPSALVLRSRAQVRAALRRLLLFPHFQAGEQLHQPDVPLLGQKQEEEAQADDDHGDDPDPVEDDLTGVAINNCRGWRAWVTAGGDLARPSGEQGPGQARAWGAPPSAGPELFSLDQAGRGCLPEIPR